MLALLLLRFVNKSINFVSQYTLDHYKITMSSVTKYISILTQRICNAVKAHL